MDRVLRNLKEAYKLHERKADRPFRQEAYAAYNDVLERIRNDTISKSKIAKSAKGMPVYMIPGKEGKAVLLTFDEETSTSGHGRVSDESFMKDMDVIVLGLQNYVDSFWNPFKNQKAMEHMWEWHKESFMHEYTHYLDDVRSHRKATRMVPDIKSKQGIIDYFNNPSELNAYFQQIATHYDSHMERLEDQVDKDKQKYYFDVLIGKDANEFLDNVKQYMKFNHIDKYFDILTPRNKKALAKRLYQLYNEYVDQMKEIMTEEVYNGEDVVDRAKELAFKAHATQKRKKINMPYTNHLERVANIVSHYTNNKNAVAAGWLHDLKEDQPDWAQELDDNFSEEVIRLTNAMNKNNFGSKEEYIQNFLNEPDEAMLIKLADRFANISHKEEWLSDKWIKNYMKSTWMILDVAKQKGMQNHPLWRKLYRMYKHIMGL